MMNNNESSEKISAYLLHFLHTVGMILLIPFYRKKLEQCCVEKRNR